MPQNFLAKLHERDFRKSTEKLLLIARNEKQKYFDKDVPHLLHNILFIYY